MKIEFLQISPTGRVTAFVDGVDGIVELSQQDADEFIARNDVREVKPADNWVASKFAEGYRQYALK